MRKSALLVSFAMTVAALALSGCEGEIVRQMEQQHLQSAASYAYSGNTAQAKLEVQKAVQEDPHNVGMYVNNSKLTETDEETLALITVHDVFAIANDYKDVEAYDREAIAKFPNDYHPLVDLMVTQNLLGETDAMQQTAHSVVTLLEAKVAKGNVDTDALTELASGYWYSGDRQKAADTYQRIFKIDGKFWPAYNQYAYEIAEANSTPDLAAALQDANTSLTLARKQNVLDVQEAEIVDTIAWVEYRQGNLKQAEADETAALEAMPTEEESLYHLGMIFLAEGDKTGAKSEIQKSLIVMPDYAEAKSEWNVVKDAPAPPPIDIPDPTDTASTASTASTPATSVQPASR